MTLEKYRRVSLLEDVQTEIQQTFFELSYLHQFFEKHVLIRLIIQQVHDPKIFYITPVSTSDLCMLRKDIAKAISNIAKQTVENSPERNLTRIAEQNVFLIGFHIVNDLIKNKELRAFKSFLDETPVPLSLDDALDEAYKNAMNVLEKHDAKND